MPRIQFKSQSSCPSPSNFLPLIINDSPTADSLLRQPLHLQLSHISEGGNSPFLTVSCGRWTSWIDVRLWSLQSYFEPWQAHVSPARRNCFCSYTSVNCSVVNTDTLREKKKDREGKKIKRATALFISCKRKCFFLVSLLYCDKLNENKTFGGLRIHLHLQYSQKDSLRILLGLAESILYSNWSVTGWITGNAGFCSSRCFGEISDRCITWSNDSD